MTTVLLVDDHPTVRAGLATLVDATSDLRVVGQVGSGADAAGAAAEHQPDVVLMDLSMPGVDGVEATRRVLEVLPDTRVVVLTSFSDRDRVDAALAAGAIGFQLKDGEPDELLNAIRSAARGHAPIDARVAAVLLPGVRGASGPGLSAREEQVLRLVTKGLANKQIARALGISERTVKAHLGRVFREIGVADRTSAALWARDHLPVEPATGR